MRPILFLDVDGVLNTLQAHVPCHKLQIPSRWSDDDIIHVPVECPHGTKRRIHNLLGHFEPVWSTAWQGGAHGAWCDHLELGRPSWPYIAYTRFKLTEMIKFAGERPWAWVDDDALWELQELGWDDRMIDGNMIINPDPRVGLTDDHVEELINWARNETSA